MQFSAQYSDGQISRFVSVDVQAVAEGLLFSLPGGQLVCWPLCDIVPVDNWRERPLRLKRYPDTSERLTINASQATDDLVRIIRRRGSPWLKGDRYTACCIVSVALLLLCATWIYSMGAGTTRMLASLVPRHVEQQLGVHSMNYVVPMLAADDPPVWCSSSQGDRALSQLQLMLAMPRDEYTLKVLRSGMINAFALPGGTIILTSALLGDMQHPDELLGVLAHEQRHIMGQHGVRGYIRATGWGFLGQILGPMDMLGDAAQALLWLHFSREDEEDADKGAVQALHGLGVSSLGLQRFILRHDARQGEDPGRVTGMDLQNYLSTHPDARQRVQAIQAQYEALGAVPPQRESVSAALWEDLRGMCVAP